VSGPDVVAPWVWPVERLGDALTALAFHRGLSRDAVENPTRIEPLTDELRLDRWLEAAGQRIGVEAQPVAAQYSDVDTFMRSLDTALLRHPDGFLAVVGVRGQRLLLLAPTRAIGSLPMSEVRTAVRAEWEVWLRGTIDALLDRAKIPAHRRERASHRLVESSNAAPAAMRGWILRLPPEARFSRQLAQAGLLRLALTLLGAHVGRYSLHLLAWWAIGVGLLQGRSSAGWLLAWAGLLLTAIPLHLLVTWYQGRIAVGAGSLLKRRLLHGAMRMHPDTLRHEGVGGFLGRAMEVEQVEHYGLSGSLVSVLALIELAIGCAVLVAGAGGPWHAVALGLWMAVTFWMGRRLFRSRGAWTDCRLDLTDATIERMIGHRTRLVQCLPERWHHGEDEALWSYLERGKSMDHWHSLLIVGIPYGWLILGMAMLAPAFIAGADTASLAVGVGGVLLTRQSLDQLTGGLSYLAGARLAWRRVAPLFHAAESPDRVTSPDYAAAPPAADDQPAIEACALAFHYPGTARTVVEHCDLTIRPGDRILLQGPSGAGKSTLAALLLGARAPSAGLLLARGLDLASLGDAGWRQRVTAAPQFHENHIFSSSFAFNLLMGQSWPAKPEEVEEAHAVCEELGLGPLLTRMPAEMLQIVGESGWQLSHGERSRVYIARALLQGCDLVILDESLAALDPENLARAIRCARARAKSLIVIAHP
jgi:ATP-binding cassette, subfamily B, bacterial